MTRFIPESKRQIKAMPTEEFPIAVKPVSERTTGVTRLARASNLGIRSRILVASDEVLGKLISIKMLILEVTDMMTVTRLWRELGI